MADTTTGRRPGHRDQLIGLTIAPLIWAAHFLVCYVFAAVWCAKLPDAGLAVPRLVVAAATVVALGGIGLVALRVFGQWGFTLREEPRHDEDTVAARHAFLSRATFLLCGLSAVATVYDAIPALFLSTCR
ncbi:hypothetical protein [Lutibaculum baratangense]|uniref:Transmembrane protein n=1 Tax=Lutibaculum baratangense AMV1 TaxID=631454 RepID=V4RET2_9HYPH|nr:hypothetical protein [Lutibaculum baratangense]ESR23869.1 hypothetical protein N177_2814 [Lutibaculum baratangense AMV1]